MERIKIFEILKTKILEFPSNHPIRVGIDGVDGAGKTRFADDFAEYLQKFNRQIIRATIDKFHNSKEVRYKKGRDSPEGYYLDSFNTQAVIDNMLKPLGPTGSLRYIKEIFDYITNSSLNSKEENAEDNAILIFDGVFLFRHELNLYWDFRIFLDVPFDITIKRIIERDTEREYLGDKDVIFEKYKSRYIPGQQLYFEAEKPKEKADIILDNTNFNNPKILTLS